MVHHQPQQVQPPQALVPLSRVYGYESRTTAPIKSMPLGFPEFRVDGRGPPGDASNAVLSPESGAYLTAGCDGVLADTGGVPPPVPATMELTRLGAVKFDFEQLRRAQTASKR